MEGLSKESCVCANKLEQSWYSCNESVQGSANTPFVTEPHVQGEMSSPCNTTGAITQPFQLKQSETKENSIFTCNINGKSLLRAQQLNVLKDCVYYTTSTEQGWEDAFHMAASRTNPSRPGYSPARSAVAQLLNSVQGQEHDAWDTGCTH